MAQAAVTEERIRPSRALTGKVWHTVKRWPIVPSFIVGMFAICAIFAPWIAPQDPYKSNLRGSPHSLLAQLDDGTRFWLGTDTIGRDILSRMIHGARIDLMVASISMASGILVGVSIGAIAGYAGGWVDEILMRVVDIWYALPFLMFALAVVIVLGASVKTMTILLALAAWSGFSRNVRGEVLTLKELDYVAMARVAGAGPIRIMFRHILPGVVPTVIVLATLSLGGLILAAAGLSFLGAGIPEPTPSWALMVAEGRNFTNTAWWISFFPGLAIFLLVMSLNFVGDWLRDRLDPRLRQLD